jgi:3-oxoadipate enol-lactonase/4-carboxymuconolactone decarboxylase
MPVSDLALSATDSRPAGEPDRLLVLLPSLGTAGELWDSVVAAPALRHPSLRILRVDFPGHGASAAAAAAFTVADLAAAVLRAIDEHGGDSFAVAGVSLGGAVALELALALPDRVEGLGMIGSGARIGSPELWRERAALVRAEGTAAIVEPSAGRWFAPGHLEEHPSGLGARLLDRLRSVDDTSYAFCCDALATFDRSTDAAGVRVPTILACGDRDAVTSPSTMGELASRIPGSRLAVLPDAAHLAVVERPAEAAQLLARLLDLHPASGP